MSKVGERLEFGTRANVATLLKKLDDAHGNKNGIPGDEDKASDHAPKGGFGSSFATNPLLYKLKAFFEVGLTKKDEEQRLTELLAGVEQHGPVSNIDRPAHVDVERWNSFRADKAIAALRFDRAPQDITERMVSAKGRVNGEHIADREVFTQRWPARTPAEGGAPSKNTTVVLSPGFLETGRNYYEQADLLNRQGYDVVIMDHQWAGLSTGKKGGIDRGFGIARDVAAVAADVAAQSPGTRVVVAGTSMGGGAGAITAQLMNDNGLIALGEKGEGPPVPPFDVVGQDPYFARTDTFLNNTLSATGNVIGVRELPLPATGAPILSHDQATLRKLAMHATTEQLTGRAQAFHASDVDLATVKGMLERGDITLRHRTYVLHADEDTLAAYGATAEWVKLMGANAFLHTIHSKSHVLEENPAEQRLLLDALRWLET